MTAFLAAPAILQGHVFCALAAFVLGPVALFRQRRDRLHRVFGYLWVTAMASLAVSGLFIESAEFAVVGPFGPIHLLSLYLLFGLWQGVRAVRNGNVAAHRAAMRELYFKALCLAGLFTFLPGRLLNRVIFGDQSWVGFVVIAAGVTAIFVLPVVFRRFSGPRQVAGSR